VELVSPIERLPSFQFLLTAIRVPFWERREGEKGQRSGTFERLNCLFLIRKGEVE
jgi:hypothetical protein